MCECERERAQACVGVSKRVRAQACECVPWARASWTQPLQQRACAQKLALAPPLQNRLSPLLLLFICLLNTLCLCPCVRLSRACLGKSNLYSIPSIGDMSLNAACDRSRYCCLLLVVAGPGVDPILNCVNATGNGPGDRQTGRQTACEKHRPPLIMTVYAPVLV